MENKIRIPKPCNENWNSMSPDKNGRFCNSCNKTVIDFTKMNNPEIQKYFAENSEQESICGHFKFNQIETEESIKYDKLRSRFSRIKIKPIKAIALFSLSVFFTLTSCMGKAAVDGEPAVISNDTINESEINNKIKNAEMKNDSVKKEIIQKKKK
ncbi:hypothetical protein DMB65_16470 [Flavobacterium cheongpyeongense]|uniref:Uncharacterized protein n=1 Tax=Flavobacterium cheongpyeongense TaxID=2212651 RepID=A0A2V4BLA5_9FLAO|nr:hypothetical protein [Flavobacterium cheongpyeongense]PXY39621.1 hypothetical protein DMB65_16470 [Flavobacterium cheongpyeongense]